MALSTVLLCVLLFALSHANEQLVKDSCFNEKAQLHHCKCENTLTLSKDSYPASEAKLMCTGSGAVKEAIKLFGQSNENILLVELYIRSSPLQHLSYNNLKGLNHLKKLVLSKNKLNTIDHTSFQDSSELEYLDLSHNKFTVINNKPFELLLSLVYLSLANNEIDTIEADTFLSLSSLTYLDLSGNNLYQMESKWFANSKMLHHLSLADNDLVVLKPNSFQHLQSLRSLDLSGNALSDLSHLVFYHLKSLRNMSLAMNNFRTLNENVFKGNKFLEKVNLTGNNWLCDKYFVPWHEWLKTHEIDKAYCSEPPELSNTTLQIGLHILYLELRLEESSICNTSMCNCTVSKDKQIVTVDCIGRGFTKLPETLPYMTRVLDLRGNHITSIATDHVNITQWADVTFLHLNNNLIDTLKGLEGNWLVRNLVALHLTNNKLNDIPIHILEQFRGGLLDELYLSGNPWTCDCNTVRFQTWLQDNYKTVKDIDGIRCSPGSGIYSNQPIYRLLKSQLCPQQIQLVNYLDVLNGLMALVIVLIIVKLSIDFWLQKRTGKLPRFFSLNM